MTSIWFEHIDKSLKKELNSIYGKNIPVYFYVARDNISEGIVYPHIQIHKQVSDFDTVRYDNSPVLLERNEQDNTAKYKEASKPYNLNYQVNLVAKSNKDFNMLTRKWFANFTKFNTLKVTDDNNEEVLVYYSSMPPVNLEETTENDDIFLMSAIQVKFRVRLDEGKEETVSITTDVSINYT